MEIQHAGGGRQQVQHRHGQQHLPAERHQLVVPVPRQRPAHPDIEEQNRAHFEEKPDPPERLRQKRSVPAVMKMMKPTGWRNRNHFGMNPSHTPPCRFTRSVSDSELPMSSTAASAI